MLTNIYNFVLQLTPGWDFQGLNWQIFCPYKRHTASLKVNLQYNLQCMKVYLQYIFDELQKPCIFVSFAYGDHFHFKEVESWDFINNLMRRIHFLKLPRLLVVSMLL